jgi:(1->4)-alpha-D-glucan 1-alpha-D-glucosylmutase
MFIPSSTYRVQLHERFSFRDLLNNIDYLHELGISTIYASPVTQAFKGSTHGYDVADPLTLNKEIGTEQDWQELSARLKELNMTWLQDIVPNHMAYDSSNPWLYDALERGRDSVYYAYFDIDTDHPVELLDDKLMAPFLGSTLTECLQKHELSLKFTEQGFVIAYYDKVYPVAAQLYKWICTVAEGYPETLITALDRFEQSISATAALWAAAKKQWLHAVYSDPDSLSFISSRVAFFNSQLHLLETLLQDEHYMLTHASLAASRINYRRFFTVNSLICLRMEKEEVFRAYHESIRRWYANGWIQGLRIDHIDGLAAPAVYARRLKALFGEDCYVVAEKILTRDELMPGDWPMEGSTGYDFLSFAGQVLTDADGSRQLLDFYQQDIITLPDYETIVYERKHNFLKSYMGGELDLLLDLLFRQPSLGTAELYRGRLKEALAALMASFPVYRVYPEGLKLSAADEQVVDTAFAGAARRIPDHVAELAFLRDLFTASHPDTTTRRIDGDAEGRNREKSVFINRLMQFTGPLAAKGIEDTTFYVYNPYIAHNEVGDSPATAGWTADTFHQKMIHRQLTQPHALNTTTTHDTKRGEDSRIRLQLLTADPQAWITAVRDWKRLCQPLLAETGGRRAPSANDEYLIYQALLGSFPEDGIVTDEYRERFAGYLTKALREAKTETNYDHPDEAYEQQCLSFAAALLQADSDFLGAFTPTVSRITRQAAMYSLSQTLIKLTSPGIPDIYQGAELWELSLVDPDNRRPVDFRTRINLLHLLKAAEAEGYEALRAFLDKHRDKGAEKLFVTYRTLNWRNEYPHVFATGDYLPLNVEGPLLAYARHHGDDWALVIVPLIRREQDLPDSIVLSLPPGAPREWRHLFSGEHFSAADGRLELKEVRSVSAVSLLVSK